MVFAFEQQFGKRSFYTTIHDPFFYLAIRHGLGLTVKSWLETSRTLVPYHTTSKRKIVRACLYNVRSTPSALLKRCKGVNGKLNVSGGLQHRLVSTLQEHANFNEHRTASFGANVGLKPLRVRIRHGLGMVAVKRHFKSVRIGLIDRRSTETRKRSSRYNAQPIEVNPTKRWS